MMLAIDCDLRQSYWASSNGTTGRGNTPVACLQQHDVRTQIILFEIASPVSFVRAPGQSASMFQLAKWALWNVGQAGIVNDMCMKVNATFLVSPSNVWTHGHKLEVRHAMACATAKKKDERECQSMLWFYSKSPKDWITLSDFLSGL
jgi:hypothetical protein